VDRIRHQPGRPKLDAPERPIIRPSQDGFDHDACYKPYMVFDGKRWLLWYNGRHGDLERIGLATLEGADLRFDQLAQ